MDCHGGMVCWILQATMGGRGSLFVFSKYSIEGHFFLNFVGLRRKHSILKFNNTCINEDIVCIL